MFRTRALHLPLTYICRSDHSGVIGLVHSFIHFPLDSQLEHSAPFGATVITHGIRHTVGLLWMSDQARCRDLSTYPGQLIHFPLDSQVEHKAPFGASVITHGIRHTVGLLWMSH
jgi:glucose/arabinose dehydrogenase